MSEYIWGGRAWSGTQAFFGEIRGRGIFYSVAG
ncbi:hypothetical protein Arad_8111 [Rhizobium rhizogenes K84]|uniref:Uncharacterized protein n=1 Tax=Rhizobium rhizogenes (strain K84 / ATCC BAA-868) TaxID=311403 RepID=B9JHR7_RHIR8|nr:hypothetical protein Arad_8111 [Rhizobium rhizogenes K84]